MIQRLRSLVPSGFQLQSRERYALIFFLIFSIGFSVLPVIKALKNSQHNKDYSTWERVALLVQDDKPIFPLETQEFSHNFFYPPASAALFYAPLYFAGPVGMVIFLCILTAVGHLTGLLLSVYLATGRVRNQPPALFIVPFLITVPFVWDNYFLGQLNLTMLAVMMVGFWALQAGRPLGAGALFASCAAAKAFPITSLVYLIWKRHWVATGSMLAALVLILVFLPAPIRGFARNLQEMETWTQKMIFESSGDSLANQPDRAYKYGNQTLVSAVHRLTRPLDVGGRDDRDLKVNLVDLPPKYSFVIAFFLAGCIGLAYVLAMPGRGHETRRSRVLEYAILLILMVIFSPKAGSFYYCWMLPGLTVVVHEFLSAPPGSNRRRWIGWAFGINVLVMASALTQIWNRTSQAMGATTWGAVLLFLILVTLLRESKKLPRSEAA